MAQVIFDENTGVTIPTTREVRDDLASAVQEAMPKTANGDPVNVDSTAPMGQLIDVVASENEAKNSEVAYLANQFNPETARGQFLDALANLYGVKRKVSEPTVVVCTCTGLKGTTIPYGVLVEDDNGNQLRHNAALGATIGSNGTVDTTFATVEHGAVEIGAGTVNTIVTVVPGWDAVTNDAAGVTGRDVEPDGELLNRMLESYAKNAHGTPPTMQSRLANLDGVLDCVVLENYTNAEQVQYSVTLEPHSVAACVVGGDDEAIAETIFDCKAAGCGTSGNYDVSCVDEEHYNAKYTYKIIRPTIVDFDIQVTFFDQNMDEVMQSNVKQAIIQDFLGQGSQKNPRVKLATTVYADRFYQCIKDVTKAPIKSVLIGMNSEGLADYVEVPANESPTISEDTISLVFGG